MGAPPHRPSSSTGLCRQRDTAHIPLRCRQARRSGNDCSPRCVAIKFARPAPRAPARTPGAAQTRSPIRRSRRRSAPSIQHDSTRFSRSGSPRVNPETQRARERIPYRPKSHPHLLLLPLTSTSRNICSIKSKMTGQPPPPREMGSRSPGWGGRREGAGRKRTGKRAPVTHRARPFLAARFPVHVTLRVLPHVWNLRSRRSLRILRAALSTGADRFGMRVCEFSFQGNHVHFVAEASSQSALSRGMQGLAIRIARGLNGLMHRSGKVLADRFHARILRTPVDVARVLRYVRANRDIHRARWGQAKLGTSDPYSSASREHGIALPRPLTSLLVCAQRGLASSRWPRRGVGPPRSFL